MPCDTDDQVLVSICCLSYTVQQECLEVNTKLVLPPPTLGTLQLKLFTLCIQLTVTFKKSEKYSPLNSVHWKNDTKLHINKHSY